ncbi:MAG: hypothetical protein GX442_23310 [Candidatus Riflebacteria bacterium]|nr:hypothetical protein [Candidatus Riflebacteria bacterium]
MTSRRLVIALLWVGCFLLLQVRNVDDVDVFTQIRLGRLALATGGLPPTEPLCFPLAGQPFIPLGWLAQVLGALLWNLGGMPLLQTARGAAYATAVVAAAAIPLAGRPPGLPGLFVATCVCLLSLITSANLRPQAIALLGFVALYRLATGSYPRGFRVAATIALGIVWQNCHPSLPAGVALVGLLAVGTIAQRRPGPAPTAGPAPVGADPAAVAAPATPGELLLLAGVLAVLQMATPLGTGIFALSRLNYTVSREWLGVSEWLPPWHPDVLPVLVPFWAAWAGTLVHALLHPGRVTRLQLVLGVPFSFLPLLSCRFVLFWAPVLAPVWAAWADQAWPTQPRPTQAWPTQAAPPQAGPVTPVTFPPETTTVATTPPEPALPIPGPASPAGEVPEPASRQRPQGPLRAAALAGLLGGLALPWLLPPLPRSEVPLAAIGELARRLPAGRIYNYREWGGPLALFGNEGWRLAIDGRLYLFPREEWATYAAAAAGQVTVASLTERYRPDAFFLRPEYHRLLIERLDRDPAWHRAWQDALAVVYLPAASTPATAP